jgi:hypothetical protein
VKDEIKTVLSWAPIVAPVIAVLAMILWDTSRGPLNQRAVASEAHSPDERRFWDRQIRIGKWLNWITGVAAAGGVFGLVFVGLGLNESRYATVASNRGWLAVQGARLGSPLVLNEPIKYQILFKNTGKSPVTEPEWRDQYATVPAPALSQQKIIDFNDIHMSDNETCEHLSPAVANGVVYPEGNGTANRSTTSSGHWLLADQSVLNGTTYVYFRGCVAYNTMGIIGKSGYCYILIVVHGDGGPVSENIADCPTGSSAE